MLFDGDPAMAKYNYLEKASCYNDIGSGIQIIPKDQ